MEVLTFSARVSDAELFNDRSASVKRGWGVCQCGKSRADLPHSLTSAGATALCLSGAGKGTSVAVLLVVVGEGLVRSVFGGGGGGPGSVTVWGTREGRAGWWSFGW